MSESGRFRQGAGGHPGGDRRRNGLTLPKLQDCPWEAWSRGVANALRPKREAHSKDTLGKVRRIGVFGGATGLTKQQGAVAMAPFED